ncbi:MAG: hypothetical protein MRZ86_04835, partial [Acidaminococcus sp.]|nr:hypothetical protein [Acidaminococcus sp.]
MKRKLVLILTVILLAVIVGTILTACGEQPPKISDIYEKEVNASSSEITKAYAWRKIYNGLSSMAKESADSSYMNFDTTIYFTFLRDGVGSTYYVRLAGTIDVYDNEHSKFLLELGANKSASDGGKDKPILGLYYLNELLYVDMTAISGGSHVLKADDIDLAKITKIVKSLTSDLDIIGTIDGLLKTEIPALGKVESVITTLLFGKSTLTDLGAGEERVDVELAFGSIIPVAIGLVQNILSGYQDVLLVVKNVFGLDLTDLSALIPNLSANLTAYFKNSEMSGVDLKAGIQYDKTHSPQNVNIELGFTTAKIENIQTVSLPEYIEKSEMKEFSFTTVSIDADVSVSTTNNTITVGGVIDSLGSLLTGILTKEMQDLLAEKQINFEGSIYKLALTIRGQLNFKDNAKTNIVFEAFGGVSASPRFGIYYVGASETLYLDLEGILGAGSRYKLDNFNLIQTIDDAIMGMLKKKEGATTAASNLAESVASVVSEYMSYDFNDGTVMDKAALYEMVKDMILTGQVKETYGANGEYKLDKAALLDAANTTVLSKYTLTSEASSAAIDTSNLTAIIAEVISNIEIVMGEQGLLNLKRFNLALTSGTLNKIVKMFNPKAELPIDNASISLERDELTGANFVLRVGLSEPFDGFSARISANVFYGSLTTMRGNKEMSEVLSNVEAKKSSYLDLAKDDDGKFKLEEIYVSLKGEFDLYTASGDFTDITYKDIDAKTTMLLQLLMKLDNTTQDKFVFSIEGNINLKDFLKSEVHLSISNAVSGETYIDLYYINKVIYLDLSFYNIAKVKIDLTDFIKDKSNEGETTAEAETSAVNMAAIIAAVISGADLGADYFEIYLAGSLVSELLKVLGLGDKLIIDNTDSMVGGLRLSFGDGLNFNEMKVNLYLSSGNRMDMNFTVSDLTVKASIDRMEAPEYRRLSDEESATYSGTRYARKTTENGKLIGYVVDTNGMYCESGYANFMESPYFYVGMNGELKLDIKAGQVDLDKGIAGLLNTLGIVIDSQIKSLVVENNIYITYKYDLQLSADLSPLVQFLKDEKTYNQMVETGSMFANNKTQFKLNLQRSLDGGTSYKTVLGLYYIGGMMYVDVEYLGLEKIALEVNLFELLMQVILGNNWLKSIKPANPEAGTTATIDFDTKYTDKDGNIKNYDLAILLSVAMSDSRILVEVADGLTELVLNKLGLGFADISASL